jgi:hypothetical protein
MVSAAFRRPQPTSVPKLSVPVLRIKAFLLAVIRESALMPGQARNLKERIDRAVSTEVIVSCSRFSLTLYQGQRALLLFLLQ